MKTKTIDLTVSLGNVCRTAALLSRSRLRFLACPLDWMMQYSLETALYLFSTKFESFFTNRKIVAKDNKCYHVIDVDNDITSIHYFPVNTNIDEYYFFEFRPIMLRRFQEIDWYIKHTRRIMFVSCRNDSLDDMGKIIKEFGMMYKKCHIRLLNMRHDSEAENNITTQERIISDRLSILDKRFCDTHPNGGDCSINPDAWIGNRETWLAILGDYSLSLRSKVYARAKRIAKKFQIRRPVR